MSWYFFEGAVSEIKEYFLGFGPGSINSVLGTTVPSEVSKSCPDFMACILDLGTLCFFNTSGMRFPGRCFSSKTNPQQGILCFRGTENTRQLADV